MWFEECQEMFMRVEVQAKECVDATETEKSISVNTKDDSSTSVVNSNNQENNQNTAGDSCGFKMEKPKMPKFSGDVREYAIFKADFKHANELTYSTCDSISFLHTCLQGKPLELIKGIGTDYIAAWEYLDSIYGDSRVVSDTILQDVVKFKPLRDGEDARFCSPCKTMFQYLERDWGKSLVERS